MSPNTEETVVNVSEDAAQVEEVALDRRVERVGGIISVIAHMDSRL
jgi:hypothetical protein